MQPLQGVPWASERIVTYICYRKSILDIDLLCNDNRTHYLFWKGHKIYVLNNVVDNYYQNYKCRHLYQFWGDHIDETLYQLECSGNWCIVQFKNDFESGYVLVMMKQYVNVLYTSSTIRWMCIHLDEICIWSFICGFVTPMVIANVFFFSSKLEIEIIGPRASHVWESLTCQSRGGAFFAPIYVPIFISTNNPPTLTGAGHQRTILSTLVTSNGSHWPN